MVVNHLGIGGQFSFGDISLQALYNIIFLDQGLAYQLEAKSNFINAIFNRSLFRLFDLTYFEITAIIGLFIFFTLKVLGKENNQRTILILITYTLGTLGYAFTMFTLYMFSYGEFESVRLASFDRYMGTYLIFATFLLIFILIYHLLKCDKIIIKMPILATLCILLPFTFQNNWKYVTINNEYRGYESRYENIELFKQIDAFIQKDDKVLVINNIYDQYIELILNYLYYDYNFDVISIGEDKEYSPEKVNLTYDEWQNIYAEYNYIYTYTTDEEFYQKYWLDKQKEYLFNNRLYAVNDDASLTLVPWNPSPINN